MAILAYSMCLLSIFYMIYSLKNNGKDTFNLTPYKIDVNKLDLEKEEMIVKILRVQYMQIAMLIVTNMVIEILAIINGWDKNISVALCMILMFVIFYQVYIKFDIKNPIIRINIGFKDYSITKTSTILQLFYNEFTMIESDLIWQKKSKGDSTKVVLLPFIDYTYILFCYISVLSAFNTFLISRFFSPNIIFPHINL